MTAGEASCRKGGVIIVAADAATARRRGLLPDVRDDSDAEGDHGDDHGEGEKSDGAGSVADPDIRQSTDGFYRDHGDLAPKEMVEYLNMQWAPSLEEALSMAERILRKSGRIGYRHPGRRGSDC